ncbi:hypothetical protein V5O48_007529 [Marasmius crinis-equi]|uniref:Uncharacterized protein n=1 Tax=Marasmius crinis-equi TaxID=585013 RepID=A0ABR3FGW1_9AGAR
MDLDYNYGRNRASIVNLEDQLNDLLASQPNSTTKEDGTIVVPGEDLRNIIDTFTDEDGAPVLSAEQQEQLEGIIALNPGMEISAEILLPLAVIADKRRSEPRYEESYEDDTVRGRMERREHEEEYGRSSSSDSTGTSRHPSRPSSRAGHGSVPQTPRGPSAFDSSRRQRATPLSSNPPSAYSKRPAAPARRKSDAGSRSDGEHGPSSYGYRNPSSRSRAPSNPTSPSPGDFSDMIGSPTFRTPSRPGSRQGRRFVGSPTDGYSSPDDTLHSPSGFIDSINSLPMPRRGDDSDEEDESALGLVMERQHTASTVSLEPLDRLELLQRTNNELSKKLQDAENTLQRKLNDHETELEELTNKVDELNAELHATKKEEKELRSKERTNSNQISTLESEIGKLTKQLESAKTTYQNLQRQYQEQCAASEKYRDDLRRRDETIRNLTDAAQMHELEQNKWARERDVTEARIAQLEEEIMTSQETHQQLEEQKQENLMLKETIDRMRYDMDELRNSLASSVTGGTSSGLNSRSGTVSKSLGAELAAKLAQDGEDSEPEDMSDEGEEAGSETVVEEIDASDDEDVIQTIIRRRRKVPSKANRLETHHTYEETKEYSDSSTQYEPDMFLVGSSTQTDPEPLPPPRTVTIVQTDPPPEKHSIEIGTDPIEEEQPEERVLVEIEVQTDDLPTESEASTSTTSETTPTTANISLPQDSPPTYDQVAYEREVQSRVALELAKHHRGHDAFRGRVVSEGLREEWQAFKEESGLECGVIDDALAKAIVIPRGQEGEEGSDDKKRRSFGSRFYRNIYNTYVYGRGAGPAQPGASGVSSYITQGALIAGASALVVGASALAQMAFANSGFGPQYNFGLAGGPTYHDRMAWAGFNAMPGAHEGFAYYGGGHHGGGEAAVWNFLGRAAEGAARAVARGGGWPT